VSDSPADLAGLESGDLILKVDGHHVTSFDDVLLETRFVKREKESFVFTVSRDGKELDIEISPNYNEDDEGNKTPSFGFGESDKRETGFVNALKYGFNATWKSAFGVFNVLGKLITGKVGASNLSGPIGVFTVVDNVKSGGFEVLIYLTAYLSVNVGVINLIPVPVFDGGRILLLIVEKITRKKVNPKVETIINNVGAILLILLMLYVTLNDIFKLF